MAMVATPLLHSYPATPDCSASAQRVRESGLRTLRMIITIGEEGLTALLARQLSNFLCGHQECQALAVALPDALRRTEACFRNITNKYYWTTQGELSFDPYHSAQYGIFLYYLSSSVSRSGDLSLANKIYYLNKSLNAWDVYHQVELPGVFFAEHPVGSVIGRASFQDYLVVQQGCTIGGNRGVYPSLGKYVWLFANSAVIGSSKIGSNVFISAGSLVLDEDVPDDTIVFGRSPNLILKRQPTAYFHERSPFKEHTSGA